MPTWPPSAALILAVSTCSAVQRLAQSWAVESTLALAELSGPYPGDLCQVCVHVLVADLHHLADALIVATGEEGL